MHLKRLVRLVVKKEMQTAWMNQVHLSQLSESHFQVNVKRQSFRMFDEQVLDYIIGILLSIRHVDTPQFIENSNGISSVSTTFT